MSGDGGDELFYGYSRYFQAYSWWSKLSLVPRFFRQLISLILTTIPGALARLLEIFTQKHKLKHLKDRIPKFARLIDAPDWLTFYDRIITQGNYPKPWFSMP